ncbi:MBL fold metallo-hydrolase [Falsiroseomonas bella]|uniref:MBL fold metallo-hydrolase n=1 Tax=Falsiroseomonas bella TaxID=2184016 RepID=A0A317F832_9PROT|nr:MBL fold metallo-hydrolase [Falsiroseomonas bella]PWS35331.1 MBL fold metallo-hydrolase [Falsiroseomonas bella]
MSGFASTNDMAEKKISFDELGPGLFAYTAEGDPNSGVLVGPDGVVVVDAQATPAMAQDVIARIRAVSPLPVTQVVLTHYHAVRVLGVAGYGKPIVIASDATRELIVERGRQDMDSEIGRFPRLFRGKETIPGLTWPTHSFEGCMTLWLGEREAQVIHIGRSHTAGDTVVWCPKEKVLFAGDTVEFGATPYCGDAHFADWPATLDAIAELGPEKMVPGRGRALMTKAECAEAIAGTRAFTSDLFGRVRQGVEKGWELKEIYDDTMGFMRPKYGQWVIFEHCMPFNVTRAFDEAKGLDHPRIWTAERDVEMWKALEHGTAMKDAEIPR